MIQGTDLELKALAVQVHDLAADLISAPFLRNLNAQPWCAVVTGLIGSQYAHHRAALVLVDSGHARQAMPIVRTGFEATVCLQWMCASSLTPLEGGQPARLPPRPKHLSYRFRSYLYIASRLLHSKRLVDDSQLEESLTGPLVVPHIDGSIADIEKRIGPEWCARVKKRRSYSGLTFKDTCQTLDLAGHHNLTYRTHSLPAHVGDALDYAKAEPDGSVSLSLDPSPASTRAALGTSTSLLLMSIIALSRFKSESIRPRARVLLKDLSAQSKASRKQARAP